MIITFLIVISHFFTQCHHFQSNLARRAAMEAKNAPARPLAPKDVAQKRTIKIGRPGYKVS